MSSQFDEMVWERALEVEHEHGDQAVQFIRREIETARGQGADDTVVFWQTVLEHISDCHEIAKPIPPSRLARRLLRDSAK